ncbi:hypothetical protein D3C77_289050 [compost metagenome]
MLNLIGFYIHDNHIDRAHRYKELAIKNEHIRNHAACTACISFYRDFTFLTRLPIDFEQVQVISSKPNINILFIYCNASGIFTTWHDRPVIPELTGFNIIFENLSLSAL